MSLRKDNSGLFTVGDEKWQSPDRPLLPRSTLENVLAAVLKRFAAEGITTVSVEEIIDAPDLEVRHDFERDTYEFRIARGV